MEKNNTSGQFNHLGAVRGLAALVVLCAHAIQIFFLRFFGLQSWPHLISSTASQYAVVVFFILSGFLITHSVELNIKRHSGKFRLAEFIAARFARLYPPFVLAVVLAIVVYLLLGYFGLPGRTVVMRLPGDLYSARDKIHLPSHQVVYALFMVNGMLEINGPLWSLYMEAKLYVMFACIYSLWMVPRRAAMVVLFAVVTYAGLRFNPEFIRYAAMWFTGCSAYYVLGESISEAQKSRQNLCIGICILIIVVDLGSRLTSGHSELTTVRGLGVWFDVSIAWAISWVLFRCPLKIHFGNSIAPYSYSLYAVHFPILLLFQSLLVQYGSRSAALATIVALVACSVAFSLAKIGGYIEARKELIQSGLLTLYTGIGVQLRMILK
jgi:peptidoglycan/LPS O-acetylase OafA/YrhL